MKVSIIGRDMHWGPIIECVQNWIPTMSIFPFLSAICIGAYISHGFSMRLSYDMYHLIEGQQENIEA